MWCLVYTMWWLLLVNNMLSVQLSVYTHHTTPHHTTPLPSTNPFLPGETFLHSLCEGAGSQQCFSSQTYYTHLHLGLGISVHNIFVVPSCSYSVLHLATWAQLYEVVEEAKFIVLQNYPEPNYHPLPLIIVIMTNLDIYWFLVRP